MLAVSRPRECSHLHLPVKFMGRRARPGFYNFPPILPSFMVNWPTEWIPHNFVSWEPPGRICPIVFSWKAIMIRWRERGRERCEMDTGGTLLLLESLEETDPSEFRRKWRRSRAGEALKGSKHVSERRNWIKSRKDVIWSSWMFLENVWYLWGLSDQGVWGSDQGLLNILLWLNTGVGTNRKMVVGGIRIRKDFLLRRSEGWY